MSKQDNTIAVLETLHTERQACKDKSKELLRIALDTITPENAVSLVRDWVDATREADAFGAGIGIVQAEIRKLEEDAKIAERAKRAEAQRKIDAERLKEFNKQGKNIRYNPNIK